MKIGKIENWEIIEQGEMIEVCDPSHSVASLELIVGHGVDCVVVSDGKEMVVGLPAGRSSLDLSSGGGVSLYFTGSASVRTLGLSEGLFEGHAEGFMKLEPKKVLDPAVEHVMKMMLHNERRRDAVLEETVEQLKKEGKYREQQNDVVVVEPVEPVAPEKFEKAEKPEPKAPEKPDVGDGKSKKAKGEETS